jgi:hypothetical protein
VGFLGGQILPLGHTHTHKKELGLPILEQSFLESKMAQKSLPYLATF